MTENPGETRELVVRPYEMRDRGAVRRISADTANAGQPVESFFPDREVFADLLTRYYTDVEPQSSWVAESGGQVVGFLTGCLDTHRFEAAMAFRIMPRLLLRGLLRGVPFRSQARRFLAMNARLWMQSGGDHPVDVLRYPAHLHVNLDPAVRARGMGSSLVERFLAYARASGVAGVHANVREDNERARRFFEKMGFSAAGRKPLMRLRAGDGGLLWSVVCVKDLGS